MRVGYGKLGRVIEIHSRKWGKTGGDNEPPVLLMTLAKRNPSTTFVVVGRNSGWDPPLPNIENPWQELKEPARDIAHGDFEALAKLTAPMFDNLDGIVCWLGQHGAATSPIPQVADRSQTTSPLMSQVRYASYMLNGINLWREPSPRAREEIWLCPDPRNYLQGRDLKWPRMHPVLSQFNFTHGNWCERYGDARTPEECGFSGEFIDGKWRVQDSYVGSGLELVGITEPIPLSEQPDWFERTHNFGVLINEAREYVKEEMSRLRAMQYYIKPLEPSWVYGKWTAQSQETLGMEIEPLHYDYIFDKMRKTKATFTTPSSGSSWATAKPWESFATGVICFFHPNYDTQGHIIPVGGSNTDDELNHLSEWLRVESPEQLARRVKAVSTSRETYDWLAGAQYRLLERALKEQKCVTTIERRLGCTGSF